MNFLKHVQNADRILLFIIAILIFTAGFQAGLHFTVNDKTNLVTLGNKDLDKEFNLRPLSNVWNSISQEYISFNQVDYSNLSYGLAKGLIKSLDDPYSDFLTPEETQIFNQELDQELEGIGAEVNKADGILKIVTPLKGSPAEKAGLKPNDIILAIDDEDTTNMNLYEAVRKIRGKQGTSVLLTIYRETAPEPLDISVVRSVIELESLTTEMREDQIYYLSINQFSNDTFKEFNKAVLEILLNNPKGLIIDLRYNGGGYLQTAIDILGEFLPSNSDAVIVKTGAKATTEIMKTKGKQRLADLKTVVLINEGSASASEILAGALQDYSKATIIGTKSHGKGTVQKIEQFRDGSSIRLTIAKWLTPKNYDIEKVGITPDIEIQWTEQDIQAKTDTQLNHAVEYLLQ